MISEVKTYKLVCDGCKVAKLVVNDDFGLRDADLIIKKHNWRRVTVYQDYFGWLSKHEDFCPNCDDAYQQACQKRQEFFEQQRTRYGI